MSGNSEQTRWIHFLKCLGKNCRSDIHHVDVANDAGAVDVHAAEQLTRGDIKIIAPLAAWLHVID